MYQLYLQKVRKTNRLSFFLSGKLSFKLFRIVNSMLGKLPLDKSFNKIRNLTDTRNIL